VNATEIDPLDRLCAEVGKVLKRKTVGPDVAIGELGFDSMTVVELMLICDQIYAISIDPDGLDLTQFTTLRQLDEQFNRLKAQAPQAAVAR